MNELRTETYDLLTAALSPEHRLLLRWYVQDTTSNEAPSDTDASDELQRQLYELHEELVEARNQLAERDCKIERLEAEIAALEAEIEGLQDERDEALTEASSLRQRLADQEKSFRRKATQELVNDSRAALQILPGEAIEPVSIGLNGAGDETQGRALVEEAALAGRPGAPAELQAAPAVGTVGGKDWCNTPVDAPAKQERLELRLRQAMEGAPNVTGFDAFKPDKLLICVCRASDGVWGQTDCARELGMDGPKAKGVWMWIRFHAAQQAHLGNEEWREYKRLLMQDLLDSRSVSAKAGK